MKSVFIEAMREPFDLTDMLAKIDYHHIRGNLTDAEREELVAIARTEADPFGGVDVMAKLEELENRIRALEGNTVVPDEGGEEAVPEYVPGKWYYAGDKVSYDGKVYTCIAPNGAVCTWSPVEYPAYWELAE